MTTFLVESRLVACAEVEAAHRDRTSAGSSSANPTSVDSSSKSLFDVLLPRDCSSRLPNPIRLDPDEPPRKKRRLSDAHTLATDSMCLLRMDVKIDVGASAHDLPEDNRSEQVFVTQAETHHALEEEAHDSLIIHITRPGGKTYRLNLALRKSSPGIEEGLRRVVSMRDSKPRWPNNSPLSSHCSLIWTSSAQSTVLLRSEIRWALGVSPLNQTKVKIRHDFSNLDSYLDLDTGGSISKWTPREFYQATHIPSKDINLLPEIQQGSPVECQLYPFQKRAIQWLIEKERQTSADAQSLWKTIYVSQKDALGREFLVDPAQGVVYDTAATSQNRASTLRGGILAEEMGLGKTVELIALMILNRRPLSSFSPTVGSPMQSQATLIITPPAILQQWLNEIHAHAPNLKVMHYQGLASSAKRNTQKADAALLTDMLSHDVVVTTYNVLSREVWYADKVPERNLRHEKKHERRRSPLVQIEWWRVCLDEAQMVESGVSAAARVACQIPRINAWAVSGTPLRKDVKDLLGLLIFLRIEPYCSSLPAWERLISVSRNVFKSFFGRLVLRHTKEEVREELRLPPQKRIVMTTPFTAIEEQNYDHLYQQMCDACGLHSDGSPLRGDWDPESPQTLEAMRRWLTRLRQTCLHPEVGVKNRRALGRGEGPLRTVAEVLEVMIDQNESSLRAEQRSLLLSKVLEAHILAHNKADALRAKVALPRYQEVLSQSTTIVTECRERLAEEKARVLANSGEADSDRILTTDDDQTDAEGKDGEKQSRLGQFRKNLRSALEVNHVASFFTATAFFQIKSNEELTKAESEEFHQLEKQETELYDAAKAVRRELLRESHQRAEKAMVRLRQHEKIATFSQLPQIVDLAGTEGIETRKFVHKLGALASLLNQQTKQLKEWGNLVIKILLSPLVDEDEGIETTGEEYEESTKKQDELYVYIDAFRALVADRSEALNGQENLLVNHEMKQLVRAAKEGEGHSPETLLQTMAARDGLRLGKDMTSLRGLVFEIRSALTALEWQESSAHSRAAIEGAILQKHLQKLQQSLTTQAKAVTGLERELDLFRSTMNSRLEFYRQLQHISDMVQPYKEELDERFDVQGFHLAETKSKSLTSKVSILKTKHRFLLHLRTEQSRQDEDGPRICVICQSPFEQGILTVCGHQYCRDCIRLWWSEHRTCPLCKRRLHRSDFHEITYKPQELQAHEENHSPVQSEQSSTTSSQELKLYSSMNQDNLNQIKSIDLDGSFGTKIDALARHLVWLREHDTGCKSIVFSQYRDFLSVLSGALKQFRIGHTAITEKDGIERFRQDPSVECFLLHAKADSSGLNLTNATHVFLCEPLINPAIELQAIARVHRIGQQRATTVYMYLVLDTVEEAIYDISVQRRLAHLATPKKMTNTTSQASLGVLEEQALEVANSFELQAASVSKLLMEGGKSGGELVDQHDLWTCLFSKSRAPKAEVSEDLEREMGSHLRAEAATARLVHRAAF